MDKTERDLSASELRFGAMIDTVDILKPFFDLEANECDLNGLKDRMGAWSYGEQIMGKFAVLVWFQENRLDFDLIEAGRKLDDKNRTLIARWIEEPFLF